MSYISKHNFILQAEVVVHNCILHDLCMPAATIFSVEDFKCAQGLLLCVCLCCVNSRWSTWVVRVGMPQKIFKPHSQISRLGMWTICFPVCTDGLLIGLFF